MWLQRKTAWTVIALLAVMTAISRSRHISTKKKNPLSVRGTSIDSTQKAEPIWVSQFTGRGIQQTQAPIDTEATVRDKEAVPSEFLVGEVKGHYVSSYMKGVPKDDDSTEEIVDVFGSLSKEGDLSAQASKKDGKVTLNDQLLAAANTADASDGTSDDDLAIKEGMLAHNSFRLLHHVQPLQWNESLAKQAQRIAKTIANDPSSFQGESPGENIAQIWHDFPHAPLKASNIWYSERKDYSFAYPQYSNKVRHFTQVVWKGTTQVGLGLASSPSNKYKIVVALYWPIGNDPHPKELGSNIPKPGGGPDVYATLKWKITKPTDLDGPMANKRQHKKGLHEDHFLK